MKKILGITAIVLFLVGGIGIMVYNHIYGDDSSPVQTEYNTTVETLIKQDKAYFDNMAGKIMFFESQVVLNKPFNEGDTFAAVEVTNIFEQILSNGDSTVYNTYEFHHPVNYTETQIIVHKNSPWFEDITMDPDSITITFDQAYQRAKQSDLIQSKSRYMTLRNPLGPQRCNPQYIIGSDATTMGVMFIDSKTAAVTDHNPAFPVK